MSRSSLSWHIDALDALGGLGYAAFRRSDLAGDEDLQVDVPSVFVAPPDFEPIQLSNRGPGLAASRQSFQIGLFVNKLEVAFPTLPDLTEFVRRCYLRGGGGDTPADDGGVPPLPADGGPPIGPIEWVYPGEIPSMPSISDAFSGQVKNFREQISIEGSRDSTGEGRPTLWAREPLGRTDLAGAWDGSTMLASAAVALMAEMVRRLPSSSTTAARSIWLTTARSLGESIAHLGLWRELLEHQAYRPSVDAIAHGLALRWSWTGVSPPNARYLLMVSVFDAPSDAVAPHWPAGEIAASSPAGQPEPLEAMERWPIPDDIRYSWDGCEKDARSLAQLLGAFLGAPNVSIEDPNELGAVLDLVLFAAACITVPHSFVLRADNYRTWNSLLKNEVHELVNRSAVDAYIWLAQQLPRRAYSELVETAIRQTSALRYASTA